MALWNALFRGRPPDFEEAFGARDLTSHAMKKAVEEWYALYYDGGVTAGRDASARLPYAVVNKLVRTVFSEYAAEYKAPGNKAAALGAALDSLGNVKVEAMQHAMIGGECLLKPVLDEGTLRFVVVQKPNYCILGRDAGGRVTSLGMAEHCAQDNRHYTLLERRTLGADGMLEIESKLYMAKGGGTLGSQVPLDTLAQYAGLRPSLHLQLGSLGLVALKMPMVNCVDASADGVSVYEAARGLIENAYRLEAQLDKEFRHAESKVIASSDMLRPGRDGRRVLDDDLFVALDDDPANVGMTVFSPAIRDESFLNRKNDLLRAIESVLGLKRGMLSEANAAERTATEITSSAGDYNLTILALQKAWHGAVLEAMRCCDRLGQLYYGWDTGECGDPVVDFGDGVLFNREQVWQEYSGMVEKGWLRPEIALAWYFDMPAGSEEELAQVRGMMPVHEELPLHGGA